MKTKGIKLTEEILDAALYGGTILGGGGGGDAKKGRKYAKLAVEYADLRLLSAEDLDDNDMVLTASLVGAPNAENQFMTPADLVKTFVLLQRNCDFPVAGIITNEQGGEATVNGWLQAAVLGLPLVHPGDRKGSHNDEIYYQCRRRLRGPLPQHGQRK